MQLEVLSVKTIRGRGGSDTTYLEVNIPNGIWPYDGNATLKLDLARGTAEDYCKLNFPEMEHQVIEV